MINEESLNKARDISNNLQSATILLDKFFDDYDYKDAESYNVSWLVEQIADLSKKLHTVLAES